LAREQEQKKSKTIKRILLFLIASSLIFTAYANRDKLSFGGIAEWAGEISLNNAKGGGYPVSISGNTVLELLDFDGDVAMLTDTAFMVYNRTGKEIVNSQHGYGSAAVACAKNRALIYDIGGQSYKIEGKTKTVLKKETTQKIISGDIAENGTYVIATRSKGFLGELTVIDKSGTQLFKWFSADANIIDVSLNDSATKIAVVTLTTSGGKIRSSLLVFEFGQKNPVINHSFDETLLTQAKYLTKNTIGCVGDNKYITVKGPGKEDLTEYDYNSGYLTGYSFFHDNGTALLISKYSDKRTPSLIYIDVKGYKKVEIPTNSHIKNVLLTQKTIYLLEKNSIIPYSLSGKKLDEISSQSDASQIAFLDNNLYVLGLNELRRY